jgi:hypothetical protein
VDLKVLSSQKLGTQILKNLGSKSQIRKYLRLLSPQVCDLLAIWNRPNFAGLNVIQGFSKDPKI